MRIYYFTFLIAYISLGFSRAEAPIEPPKHEFHALLFPNQDHSIRGLGWSPSKETLQPLVQTRTRSNDQPSSFVRIKGSYNKNDGNLFCNGQTIPLDAHEEDHGFFTLEVDINSAYNKFTLTFINGNGERQEQEAEILFPDWEEFKKSQSQPQFTQPTLQSKEAQRSIASVQNSNPNPTQIEFFSTVTQCTKN